MNPGAGTVKPLVIWQLSDGRAGHLSQTTGLVNALLDRVAAETHLVKAPSSPSSIYSLCTKHCSWGKAFPRPHVVVGAGHGVHLPMLAVRRAFRATAIVLMRPGLPLSWFDHCLIPEHDNPPSRKNVTVTRGALNPMRHTDKHERRRGLILIGGPSRHYHFDNGRMMGNIKRILSGGAPQYWTLSTSPRTPASLIPPLTGLRSAGVNVVFWDQCGEGWLTKALSRACSVWVSEDSVSMIYEALTSGCCVGLLPLPKKGRSRIHRAVDGLIEKRFVTPMAHWLHNRKLPAPAVRLDEANRCAQILIDRGLLAQTSCR